ncbi:hypothetical protein DY000_02026299 [Brassica cretica]|uniref:Zinc finger PHD-type domain-containing protein n=1 Tax=Brassica cretica TaxID=69181 RepID=A0ABQ7EM68_BRACR|nr:hypothetical protein DY000_02026299 [Brassica cretica]
MDKVSFEASVDFVCADCSKRTVQNRLSTASIKAAPPRIQKGKARVESSNPVPRWKKIPESSKMRLISPEEVRKLSFSGGNNSTFKVPKPVPARSPTGLTKLASFPRSRSLSSTVVARKTNHMLLPPPKRAESPRPLQIRSGVMQQSSKRQAVVEGSKVKVGGGAKDLGSKEICRSILSEKLLQLLPHRPALPPIWKGRILDSATPSEFNGVFWAQPASVIRKKAYNLSKTIPVVLKVELVPIGSLLNDLFANRKPALSDVEMYIFPDDKNTIRFKEEHAYLFETMKRRNAMIRINVKDTPLLIFSSKVLDKSSQIIIEMQKKTKNFLWGIFLVTKKSLALVPGTSNQAAQSFDAGDVVDNTAKVCLLPSPLCFLSQKPFNYQMLAVDSFWLESIIYIFKVLVLDSDVGSLGKLHLFSVVSASEPRFEATEEPSRSITMEIRNGNKDKSESSSLSSKKATQESKVKAKNLVFTSLLAILDLGLEGPCEICGSVGIAGLMMICFNCRHTREHTYCARVALSPVRDIWLCEACRFPSRVLFISHVADDLMDTETTVADPKNTSNSRVDDHGTAKLRANDMEEVVDTREASTRVMHLPSQPHTRPLAKETLSSQNKEQHQPTQAFPKKRRTIRECLTKVKTKNASATGYRSKD